MGPRRFRRGSLITAGTGTQPLKLQWGRDVSVAEVALSRFPANSDLQASMGPRRFRRGSNISLSTTVPITIASMGPRRFRRGSSPWCREPIGSPIASMGPRRFRRGSSTTCARRVSFLRCFNGAATFPSRKSCSSARMGTAMQPLQWGRDVSVAEVPHDPSVTLDRPEASMGPRRFRRGSRDDAHDGQETTGASMGPRRFRRGSSREVLRRSADERASMGPRRFRRGSAGIVIERLAGDVCFNGAATFPSRKFERLVRWIGQQSGFNGAATFPSRKSAPAAPCPMSVSSLQWGRDVSVAEVFVLSGHGDQHDVASMGPRRFRRGSGATIGNLGIRYMASMGPRRFRRGSRERSPSLREFSPLQWGRDVSVAEVNAPVANSFSASGLQWGRDVSVAEVSDPTYTNVVAGLLQWGRDVSVAEVSRHSGIKLGSSALQWGRDVSVAEVTGCSYVCLRDTRASMGPRRFRRGSLDRMPTQSLHHHSFNGAATFPSRKYLPMIFDAAGPIRFNGAATFPSRK